MRDASAKLYNPYKHFLWCPTTRNCIITFSKPELQDVLVKLNDLTGHFLNLASDNLLVGALFLKDFSLGYPKNNDCALNLDDIGTIIQWQGKENREIAQSTIALLSNCGII